MHSHAVDAPTTAEIFGVRMVDTQETSSAKDSGKNEAQENIISNAGQLRWGADKPSCKSVVDSNYNASKNPPVCIDHIISNRLARSRDRLPLCESIIVNPARTMPQCSSSEKTSNPQPLPSNRTWSGPDRCGDPLSPYLYISNDGTFVGGRDSFDCFLLFMNFNEYVSLNSNSVLNFRVLRGTVGLLGHIYYPSWDYHPVVISHWSPGIYFEAVGWETLSPKTSSSSEAQQSIHYHIDCYAPVCTSQMASSFLSNYNVIVNKGWAGFKENSAIFRVQKVNSKTCTDHAYTELDRVAKTVGCVEKAHGVRYDSIICFTHVRSPVQETCSLSVILGGERDSVTHKTPNANYLTVHPSWYHVSTIFIEEIVCECNTYRPPVVVIKGEKGVGKTTFSMFLINQVLNVLPQVAYLETDLGQPLLSPPGLVCLYTCNTFQLSCPLVGVPHSLMDTIQPKRSCFVGNITVDADPELYLQCIANCINDYNKVNTFNPPLPLIINTHGWVNGVGLYVTEAIGAMSRATMLIEIPTNRGNAHTSVLHSDIRDERADVLSKKRKLGIVNCMVDNAVDRLGNTNNNVHITRNAKIKPYADHIILVKPNSSKNGIMGKLVEKELDEQKQSMDLLQDIDAESALLADNKPHHLIVGVTKQNIRTFLKPKIAQTNCETARQNPHNSTGSIFPPNLPFFVNFTKGILVYPWSTYRPRLRIITLKSFFELRTDTSSSIKVNRRKTKSVITPHQLRWIRFQSYFNPSYRAARTIITNTSSSQFFAKASNFCGRYSQYMVHPVLVCFDLRTVSFAAATDQYRLFRDTDMIESALKQRVVALCYCSEPSTAPVRDLQAFEWISYAHIQHVDIALNKVFLFIPERLRHSFRSGASQPAISFVNIIALGTGLEFDPTNAQRTASTSLRHL